MILPLDSLGKEGGGSPKNEDSSSLNFLHTAAASAG
jgi:hypothetical protein